MKKNIALINQTQLLDVALKDKPAAVQAKAREMAQKLNISPDDELFLFVAIICNMEVLLETGPQKFEHAITHFQEELNQWSDLNLATLAKMAQKSETLSLLATSSEKLMNTLTELNDTCSRLIAQLQTSNQQLNGCLSQLSEQQMRSINSLHQMETSFHSHTQHMRTLQKTMSSLTQKVSHLAKKKPETINWTSKILATACLSSGLTVVLWLVLGWLVLPRLSPLIPGSLPASGIERHLSAE